ncbi:MAG: class I SAM-dependent methyltransferase [Anaerolineae bacterium]
MEMLSQGNVAKLYCLNWLDQYAAAKPDAVLLDMGCGEALNFVKLLQKYPKLRYIGIEPSQEECERARRNTAGLNATIINGYAYDMLGHSVQEPVDVVISFSVFEHVYRRLEYLQAAQACMKPDGYFLINYDAGHFVQPASLRERVKNILGPVIAKLGNEGYYQAFVREQDFLTWVKQAGLKIFEARSFNTRLKGIYKLIPQEQRAEYMQHWYDFELWLSSLNLPYDDRRANTWFTRNYILTRADM